MKGRIEVICGPMFSGKTSELLRRIKRYEIAKQKVVSFKPSVDDRYSEDCIASHSGQQQPSIVLDNTAGLIEFLELKKERPHVVAIEEVQFFDKEIISVIKHMVYNMDIRVVVAGLDMDYKGKPFPVMAELLSRAEKICKLHAVCTICGGKATKTAKLGPPIDNSAIVDVGGIEKYEPRCSFHWMMNGNL